MERADSRFANYCPHSGGSDSQRAKFTAAELSLEAMVYKKRPNPVLSGKWGNPPSTPKNQCLSPRRGKHVHAKNHNVSLHELEGPTLGAPKNRRNILFICWVSLRCLFHDVPPLSKSLVYLLCSHVPLVTPHVLLVPFAVYSQVHPLVSLLIITYFRALSSIKHWL